jgi:phosphoglycolate phosphatase-like HAD superfamily hydrolase
MQSKEHKLLLFDIDGTLVLYRDKLPRYIFEDMVRAFFEKDVSLEGYRFSGKTDKNIIREVLALGGIGTSDYIGREIEIMEWIADEVDRRTTPESFHLLPRITELLDELTGRDDTTVALLTGNLPRCAEIKLNHFDLNKYFSFGVFGIESINRNDLGPLALKHMSDIHGIEMKGEHTVVIGDAIPDVLCAKHIGAKSLITLTGRTTREEVEPYKPDYIFNDLSDTAAVLATIYQ